MPHVERDSHAEEERTLCEDDASLMQAWSEEGADLVRRRWGSFCTCRLTLQNKKMAKKFAN